MANVEWWHMIDLGHGIVTPGKGGSRQTLARMRLPEDLTGRTVLDIGTWDGAFAFEAERRGAARVVALDQMLHPGFTVARRALDSNVEFVRMDVMDMTPEKVGTFDLVLYMGVIYHLPNPVGGLLWVRDVTRGQMILETDSTLNWIARPAAEFRGVRAGLTSTAPNWWIPNVGCIVNMRAGLTSTAPNFGAGETRRLDHIEDAADVGDPPGASRAIAAPGVGLAVRAWRRYECCHEARLADPGPRPGVPPPRRRDSPPHRR